MLIHKITTDKRTSSTETSSAVHGYTLTSSFMLLHNDAELLNDRIIRTRTVGKLKFVHFDACLLKKTRFVQWFIQPDDGSDSQLLENGCYSGWLLRRILAGIG